MEPSWYKIKLTASDRKKKDCSMKKKVRERERETERKERQRNIEAKNEEGERTEKDTQLSNTNGQKKRFSLPMKKKKQKPIEILPRFAIKNEKKSLTFLSDFLI